MKPSSRGSTWRPRLEACLLRIWFEPAPGAALRLLRAGLVPFSWLTQVVSRRRRQAIAMAKSSRRAPRASDAVPNLALSGGSAARRPPRPCIVVIGNLVAGGGGKTPLTLALTDEMHRRGFKVGLLARGTGTLGGTHPHRVAADDDPALAGDEALLLARKSGAPVVIGRRRGAALGHLLAAVPDLDIVFSDDGLQHAGLPRDLEIVMLDKRGLGNGRLLPAGPLRESAQLLTCCDAVVDNRGWLAARPRAPGMAEPETHAGDAGVGLPARFDSVLELVDLVPLAGLETNPGSPLPERPTTGQGSASASVADITRQLRAAPIAAIAGIANPESFFSLLESLGATVTRHTPGDHGRIDAAFVATLPERMIVMTEKDAVRCGNIADDRIHVLRIAAVPDPALGEWLARHLRKHLH